ncbi:MAG: DUF1156 domain-containing protein, partial [Armatimonadota bacterium]|nr:DUF1156 domain-containing protein [Armatimonadota bacterium]
MSDFVHQTKRLIEVAFPLREVSAESAREKSIRHGHISTLHIWWARRPLAACRAAIFEALVPDPDDPNCPPAFRSLVEELVPSAYDSYDRDGPHPPLRRRLLGFVADLCKWENSNNQRLLEIARRLIREANGGLPAPRPGRFFVYALKCSDGSFYIGQTEDISRCLQDHREGRVQWTRTRGPVEVIHWEEFSSREEAVKREKDLKTGFGRKWLKREYAAGLPRPAGSPPRVLDPFAGGGSIPLEALRLGCEAHASDLNPVAVLILKCTVEYPQKYGLPARGAQAGQPDSLPAPRPGKFFVYVLKCNDDSFYIGQTDDVPRRLEDHQQGRVQWTRNRQPVQLIHWEEFDSREDAVKREKDLKTGFGRKWLKREYAAGRTRQAGRPVPNYIHEMDRREAEAKGQQRLTDGDGSLPAAFAAQADWAAAYRRNPLATDVRYWGQWVLERARQELAPYYPPDPDGKVPVAYLWARTVKCPNPACGAEMPLIRQYWLARKDNRKVALEPVVDRATKTVRFRVVEGDDVKGDPAQATTERGDTTCVVCGAIAKARYVRSEAAAGRMDSVMTAVVLGCSSGKVYRPATQRDVAQFSNAVTRLKAVIGDHDGSMSPIPDEPMDQKNMNLVSGRGYGFQKWADLFNDRQLLALTTFVRLVREAHAAMLDRGLDAEYAKAVATYLALALDRLADYNSALCRWAPHGEYVGNTLTRQALPMVWDFLEVNPFSGATGDFAGALEWVGKVVAHTSHAGTRDVNPGPQVTAADVRLLPQPDSSIPALLTDPPYYDSVSYADLSDFFYVWLKRSIGNLYPELFGTPLTPKAAEIIENPYRQTGREKAEAFYKEGMAKAFAEMRRVLQPGGVAWVIFAHTATEAWETLVSALVDQGFTVTASWPVHTEMATRIRAADTASLASSVFLVCRPRSPDAGTAYLHEVSEELRSRIRERLDYFWAQGIRGADFFVSAIGPALEVYSRHAEVRTTAGDPVTVRDFLELVRREVIDYALAQVLGGTSPPDPRSDQRRGGTVTPLSHFGRGAGG